MEQRGHRALAVDLPGMGSDRRPANCGTLAGYADHVVTCARALEDRPIIVGHSLGGATISEAGERAPEVMLGLVYVTAALVPNGICVNEMLEAGLANSQGPRLRTFRDGAPEGCVVMPDEDLVGFLYQLTDEEGQACAVAKVTPQAVEPMAVPLRVTPERWGRLPRAYIECTQDRALPIEVQRATQMAFPCDPVIAIDTDHSPFFSAPNQLADALDEIARAWIK